MSLALMPGAGPVMHCGQHIQVLHASVTLSGASVYLTQGAPAAGEADCRVGAATAVYRGHGTGCDAHVAQPLSPTGMCRQVIGCPKPPWFAGADMSFLPEPGCLEPVGTDPCPDYHGEESQ